MMAVETATERAIFFEADDFAVTASYTPQGGSATNINGIFDNEYFEADAGGTITGIAIQQPRFVCQTSDVSSAREGRCNHNQFSGTHYSHSPRRWHWCHNDLVLEQN